MFTCASQACPIVASITNITLSGSCVGQKIKKEKSIYNVCCTNPYCPNTTICYEDKHNEVSTYNSIRHL